MIALLTDFGVGDIYAGVMRAVIQSIAPGAIVEDLTHAIPSQDIRTGAVQLAAVWPYLPMGAVVVAVVDPGVGTARRPIAVDCSGRIMVGPDNGLITRVAMRHPIRAAVEITNPQVVNTSRIANTFHGRDVFAPAAARLCAGMAKDDLGPEIADQSLTLLEWPVARFTQQRLETYVLLVDSFGNVILDAAVNDFTRWRGDCGSFRVDAGAAADFEVVFASSYNERAGSTLLLVPNSYDLIEIAAPNDSAAARIGNLRCGDPISIELCR